MNTNYRHPSTNFRRSLNLKLPSFQDDGRLAFVDSVCASLITSRFLSETTYTPNPGCSGGADEPFDYIDVLNEGRIGWRDTAGSLARTGLGHAFSGGALLDAFLRRSARTTTLTFGDTTLGRNLTPSDTPANPGRGSPTFLGRSS